MGKVKIYDPKKEAEKEKAKERLIVIFEIVFDLVIYAVILMLASLIFKGLYIENFAYAFLASAIIAALNATIKPILVYLTLPLTLITFGIFYPVVNVIVLKLCGLFLGSHFVVEGIIGPFFLVLFVSLLKMIVDSLVTKRIIEGR